MDDNLALRLLRDYFVESSDVVAGIFPIDTGNGLQNLLYFTDVFCSVRESRREVSWEEFEKELQSETSEKSCEVVILREQSD